jgi:hypothetical protein
VRTLIIAAAFALSAASIGQTQAPQPARNTVYLVGNPPRTVTISQSGVVLTTLAVPQGTILSVTYDTAGSVIPTGDGRFVFHGTVEMHAMVGSQKPQGIALAQAMLLSPLNLTATGVDVEIARTN